MSETVRQASFDHDEPRITTMAQCPFCEMDFTFPKVFTTLILGHRDLWCANCRHTSSLSSGWRLLLTIQNTIAAASGVFLAVIAPRLSSAVTIPRPLIFFLSLAFILLAITLVMSHFVRFVNPIAAQHCPKCNYDLSGHDHSVCPECGNPLKSS